MPWTRHSSANIQPFLECTVERTANAMLPLARSVGGNGSLQNGTAGIALFLAYAARHFENKNFRAAAGALLQDAFTWVARTPPNPSLYNGFVGVAWVAQHLRKDLHDFVDPSGLSQIDEALLGFVSCGHQQYEHDLLKGLGGIGVYALERSNAPLQSDLLNAVIARLSHQAHHDENGATWFTPPASLDESVRSTYPGGLVNLGVAHGLPGCIGFLVAAIRSTLHVEPAAALLLQDSIRWMISKCGTRAAPSYFAMFCGRRGECWGQPLSEQSAPLGWCYGDAAIASIFYQSATLLKNSQLLRAAGMLNHNVRQMCTLPSHFPDALHLCHGQAGLLHTMRRNMQARAYSNDDANRPLASDDSAMREYEEFLDASLMDVARRIDEMPANANGFLLGRSGVALTLLHRISDRSSDWDRLMLLNPNPHCE